MSDFTTSELSPLQQQALADITRSIEKIRDNYAAMVTDLTKCMTPSFEVLMKDDPEKGMAQIRELTAQMESQSSMNRLSSMILSALLSPREPKS